ncbi:MAG TPA: nitrate reductase molybdenum cofactor assembly chaperone [Rhodanobacteraceae bacterium]|nr:nitrate reductase molybdenum cofactor assembly chaperone [Rhodanobacteraceae bacterium]
MSLLKLVGLLLDYPTEELWQHGEELLAATQATGLPSAREADLATFVRELLASDPMDAQQRWLETFDRGRSMSLLLFEHIHGESRDRGQAMVDLIEAYRKHGLEISVKELPDYLPLLLEFLSGLPQVEARDWLGHVAHIVGMLAARAAERESPYRVLFETLVECANGKIDAAALRAHARKEVRDDTPEAMDRLWEEEAVRFGNEAPDESCDPPTRRPSHGLANRQVQP